MGQFERVMQQSAHNGFQPKDDDMIPWRMLNRLARGDKGDRSHKYGRSRVNRTIARYGALLAVPLSAGSIAFGGSLVTTRWMMVGITEKSEVMALGQEVEVKWRGNRKDVKHDDQDLIRRRGRAILTVDGAEVALRPEEPLDGGYVAAAAFDGERERFVLIRNAWRSGDPSRCFFVYRDGTVRPCSLLANYHYQFTFDYLFDHGRKLRFVDMAARPWRFWEMDMESQKTRELTDKTATLYMGRKLSKDGRRNETIQYGTPSPDGLFTVRTLARKAEFTSETGTVEVSLPDSLQRVTELSPLGSLACRDHLDSITEIPWELSALIWSHSGTRVYWCGLKSERGFVVDPRSGLVITGPCLRGASWNHDDSAIAGVADCGHRIEVWRVSEDIRLPE